MLDLAKASTADFIPRLNEEFELLTGTGGITLCLVEIPTSKHSHPGGREPFSLQFQGAPGLRLPQGIYELRNLTLGAMELFLVQIGDGAKGSTFEAVFN